MSLVICLLVGRLVLFFSSRFCLALICFFSSGCVCSVGWLLVIFFCQSIISYAKPLQSCPLCFLKFRLYLCSVLLHYITLHYITVR